jgi:hypothetical protein
MKTLIILFPIKQAEVVGMLLHSLELKILMIWTIEGDLFSDGIINCVLKLNDSNKAISPELQIEKLREKSFIKIKSQ